MRLASQVGRKALSHKGRGGIRVAAAGSDPSPHREILVLFPEGTRGRPETLQEFKKGIGHLARARPSVPVVPIFMHGLGKALPKGSALLVPFNVTVNVGEKLYGTESYAEFVSKLERAMTALAVEEKLPVWE